jgi:ATP-dependent Clp protease ATP-binding subunit ClpB
MSSYFELGMDKKLIVPYADYMKAMKPNFEYVGDRDEILDVVKTLDLPTAHSVKIVSPSGAGATALLDALAFHQHSSFMPDNFMIRPLFKFNGDILFNTSDNKAIEARFAAALQELKQYSEQRQVKPVLLIDNGWNFISSAPQHVINNLIEATVHADFLDVIIQVDKKKEEDFNAKHSELANSFTKKELEEPGEEQTFKILKSRARIHEAKGVHIEDDTLRHIVRITQDYKAMYDTAQPNRAVRLLDSTATGFYIDVHSKAPGAWEKEKQLQTLEIEIKAEGLPDDEKESLASQAETLRIELAKGAVDWKTRRVSIEKVMEEIRKSENLVRASKKKIDSYDSESRRINAAEIREGLKGLEPNDPLLKGRPKDQILNLDEQSLLDFAEFDMTAHRNSEALKEEKTVNNQNTNIANKQKELNDLGNLHGTVTMPASEVEKVATAEVGSPVGGIEGQVKENLLNGMTLMKEDVFGQDHVLKPMIGSLRRAAAGLNDPNRPLGDYIIGGPPGTGKSWIGRSLAVKIFGSEKFLRTLNMENYQKDHTVSDLIGAPPGFAGCDKKGKLIEIAEEMPFGVLMLDEIEKAHPDVRQALLKVKGSGRLDGFNGFKGDFRKIIIVETTNFGQEVWIGNDFATAEQMFQKAIRSDPATFSPEYLDRADGILCAGPLDEDSLFKIVERKVKDLRKLVNKRGISIEAPAEDLRIFVQVNCLHKLSGRKSEMEINQAIGDPLADILLTGKPVQGTLTASFNRDSKAFTTSFLRATVQAPAVVAAATPKPMVA